MGNLIRIWKNPVTGELSESKVDESYETTNLVFDSDTGIVYYKFSEVVPVYSKRTPGQSERDTKVGFMSPYVLGNGKYCCFRRGIKKLEPID